ncbi:MAG: DUF3891 family protein [Pirellulales bacterium]
MIRRPWKSPAGKDGWALITQIEHARLAGDLAVGWRRLPSDSPQLLQAIYHHDDGWANWELRPDIEPESGLPRDFMEMPLADSLPIWRESIDIAANIGPLAGYIVSRHFSVLLERGMRQWDLGEQQKLLTATAYLRQQSALQTRLLLQWQPDAELPTSRAKAENTLAWLQFFDGLSLWLCCQPRTEPYSFQPPQGPDVHVAPTSAGEIEVAPWPFSQPQLCLTAAASAVSEKTYESSAALGAAPRQPLQVVWNLYPAPPENRQTKT